jgi:histidinol-phosphatase
VGAIGEPRASFEGPLRMSTNYGLADDLAFAHELADTARELSLTYFRRQPKQYAKPDGSIVTEADQAVEDELRRLLAAARPDDAILGEERGASGSGARRWVIDPIDGTNEFVRGGTQWWSLIALEIDGRIAVGVCEQPAVQRRCWAIRGGGAFNSVASSNPAPMRVTRTSDLSAARVFVAPPEWLRDASARQRAAALAAVSKPEPHVDHPALQVAAGGYEAAVFFFAGPWDLAAPSIVVEEAGGKFTDTAGHYDIAGSGAVFSNGLVHDAVIAITK